ncbi:MAG: hypothetical protein JWO21_863 [Solirubrobacterales bacterium]|jgi:hypothetical protein|nr:hypothetical protein [Solirubrobacterales bacterium]
MEIGAFLIFIIAVAVLAVGGVLLLVAARLRRAKLDPEEDKLEGRSARTDASEAARARPEHLRVHNEQRSELVPKP